MDRSGYKLVAPHAEEITLRGDTDFTLTAELDRWDGQGVKFIFGMDAHPKVVTLAEALPEEAWKPLERLPRYELATAPRRKPQRVKESIGGGGVHALAYARALESLTGVKMSDMLPIPNIGNAVFPEARKFMEKGLHLKLYRFSPEDYKEAGTLWTGAAPDGYAEGLGGSNNLEFVDAPPAGGNLANLAGIASSFAPNYAPEEIMEIAQKLYKKAKNL